MTKKTRKRCKKMIMITAAVLLTAAVFIMLWCYFFEKEAAQSRDLSLPVIEEISFRSEVFETPERIKEEEKDTAITLEELNAAGYSEMPVISYDGVDYIGVLEIPSINLRLPVISEWNYPALRKAPCRYSGTLYGNDLCICGHNLPVHFGDLKNVAAGAEVLFTDANGQTAGFTADRLDIIPQADLDLFYSGVWDLTLFTCRANRIDRIALRCRRKE